MKKLKLNLSPNLGEVLSKKDLQTIVGGCSVSRWCICHHKENGVKVSDKIQLIDGDEAGSYTFGDCENKCKAEYKTSFISAELDSEIRRCGWASCTMYGSGSGSE